MKMEKMQALLRSMTPTERAKFKWEINPQMRKMQAHLRTMTTTEQQQFKREIAPNTTQRLAKALQTTKTKPPVYLLSRETSPHTDQNFAGMLPSRETGPHPNKSIKKLAQALKKRAKYEDERIRELIRPPERCKKCGGEHLTLSSFVSIDPDMRRDCSSSTKHVSVEYLVNITPTSYHGFGLALSPCVFGLDPLTTR